MVLFSLLGSTMGFSVETFGFYALFLPLMAALGYDRMTTSAMVILGASTGAMASTVNPFSIGVASGEAGVSIGDTLLVGPAATPIVIDGWVEDTNYLQQSALWVTLDTWRTVQNANRPDAFVADGIVQVLVVQGDGDLATSIDAATGSTSTLTRDDAVSALPGVREQSSTFNAIISSTLVVVLAVVGLFFSLLTLERTGLYGVLKAIGASTRRLFAGVVLQAVVVSVVAFVIGGLLAWFADRALSADVPLQLTVGRYVFTFVALVIAAVLGSAISLRRVTRIDPASAIGSAT
jgi:putative ABC transport system permease protein